MEETAGYDSILPSWVTDNRAPTRVRCQSGLLDTLGIDGDELPDLVEIRKVCEPDHTHRHLYDERFHISKQLYRRNRRLYRRLNEPRHNGNTA